VRLPPTGMPLLAYSGTVEIIVPLLTGAGMHGTPSLSLVLTHQVCDSQRCDAPRTTTASAAVHVEEPPALDDRLAFRLDAGHAIVLANSANSDPSVAAMPAVRAAAHDIPGEV